MISYNMKGAAVQAFALIISLTACADRGTGTPLLPAATANTANMPNSTHATSTVFIDSRNANAVLGFSKTAHGNAAPTVTIAGANTQLSAPDALALDPNSGKLYVVNDGGQGALSSEVLIFPKGANGNVTPKTISGSKVPFKYSEGVALDAAGKIYVSDYKAPAIYVFPAGASGNVAPIRTIGGSNTMLTNPVGMAFDASGNLWVTNANNNSSDHLIEFAPGANGNVVPIATIGGSKTKLGNYVFNVSIDSTERLIVANTSSVEVFPAGAHGNVKPSAIIAGSATKLTHVVSVGTDGSNIYATNYDYSSDVSSIVEFDKHAHGNQAPLRTIAGPKTRMNVAVYPSFY